MPASSAIVFGPRPYQRRPVGSDACRDRNRKTRGTSLSIDAVVKPVVQFAMCGTLQRALREGEPFQADVLK